VQYWTALALLRGVMSSPAAGIEMLKDLPPGVAQTETKRTKAQIDFDKKLQICRKC